MIKWALSTALTIIECYNKTLNNHWGPTNAIVSIPTSGFLQISLWF